MTFLLLLAFIGISTTINRITHKREFNARHPCWLLKHNPLTPDVSCSPSSPDWPGKHEQTELVEFWPK